ncbi:MAG: ATP-binding protein [Flavobacteriales bacterium]|nr:ATP-binding protein [Flavobacteriales bacterium]
MKKVVLTGPESTGKTTLCIQMGEEYDCPVVEEYARSYIRELDRPYDLNDLKRIAEGQIKLEERIHSASHMISDTDLLTIKIWSEYKYDACDQWILDNLNERLPDLYLLCYPDLIWESDPLRENPEDLMELYEIYLKEIKRLNVPYRIIKGSGSIRLENCKNALREINFK